MFWKELNQKKRKTLKIAIIKNILKFFFHITPLLLCGQDTIYFNSANPFSFKDIIIDLETQQPQSVYGVLRMPDYFIPNNRYPVIIAVAGSNGWSDHHYEYLSMYRSHGIATFELCSFQSRGVSSTVGTQFEVTTAMMVLDSYQAYELLLENPNIKSDKIGITGWSLGGGVSLFSAWKPLNDAINEKVNFAVHLPIYPPCIVVPEMADFGHAPIHILIGQLDNWTPADACLDFVNKVYARNINITVYPDAHHSFDSNSELMIEDNGYILEDCRFSMKSNGTVCMNFLNIPMTTPILQKIGLMGCARRGPTYGSNQNAKRKAFLFAEKFMIKYLND